MLIMYITVYNYTTTKSHENDADRARRARVHCFKSGVDIIPRALCNIFGMEMIVSLSWA